MKREDFESQCSAQGVPSAVSVLLNSPSAGAHLASKIPGYMHEGVANYLAYGIAPGKFLSSVLANDLCSAAIYADDANVAALHHYAAFLRFYCPTQCYGSPERVEAWSGLIEKETTE